MNDARAQLAELSRAIRDSAVARQFELEGYSAAIGDGQVKDVRDGLGSRAKQLDVATYERFASGRANPSTSVETETAMGEYYAIHDSPVWKYVYRKLDLDSTDYKIMWFGNSNGAAAVQLVETLRRTSDKLCARADWRGPEKAKALNERNLNVGNRDALLGLCLSLMSTGQWQGKTMDVYHEAFGGDKWDFIIEADYMLSEMLTCALEAQVAINITTRESIVSICEATLEKLGLAQVDVGVPKGVKVVLKIVGAIAPLAFRTAMPGASAVIGAAQGILNELLALAPQPKPRSQLVGDDQFHISGGTPSEIITSMHEAIERLTELVAAQEGEVAEKLRATYNQISTTAERERFELTFKKPVHMTDGDVRATNLVAANAEVLETVALNEFPAAAAMMSEANGQLVAAGDGGAAFKSELLGNPSPAHEPWSGLRSLLQDFTGNNAAKTKHAGQVLFRYVVDTGIVDNHSAREIDDIGRRLDEISPRLSGRDHKPLPAPEPRDGGSFDG